jgi:hypothetical protein
MLIELSKLSQPIVGVSPQPMFARFISRPTLAPGDPRAAAAQSHSAGRLEAAAVAAAVRPLCRRSP